MPQSRTYGLLRHKTTQGDTSCAYSYVHNVVAVITEQESYDNNIARAKIYGLLIYQVYEVFLSIITTNRSIHISKLSIAYLPFKKT